MKGFHGIPDKISPRLQSHWDARAATNFICGGAGGGLLVAAALASLQDTGLRPVVIVALALVGTGLTAVWFEIGKPMRALNVYRNAATSWMTREAMVAPLLFASGAAAVVFGWPAALWIAGVLGFAYAYAQGRILYASKGIPAWRHPGALAMVVTTNMTEGAGLLCAAVPHPPAIAVVGIVLAALVAVRFLVWRSYSKSLHRLGAPSGTLKAFDAIDFPFVWLGHAVPFLLAIVAALAGWWPLLALAGIVAAAAGAWFKYVLVRRAAFTQGFALPRTPSRGSGGAGAGGAPGWVRARGL